METSVPIIVSGKLYIKSGRRDEFIERSLPSIELARKTNGCNDFSVSIDPIDQNRVNIYEMWVNQEALDAFRNSGPEDDLFSLVESFNVKEYDLQADNT